MIKKILQARKEIEARLSLCKMMRQINVDHLFLNVHVQQKDSKSLIPSWFGWTSSIDPDKAEYDEFDEVTVATGAYYRPIIDAMPWGPPSSPRMIGIGHKFSALTPDVQAQYRPALAMLSTHVGFYPGDWLVIPISCNDLHAASQRTVFNLISRRVLTEAEAQEIVALCHLYSIRVAILNSVPKITDKEIEILRWLAAGKTLHDTAAIVGLSYRTVRYHLDRIRARYGYATNVQVLVRAARDYWLDPLGHESD